MNLTEKSIERLQPNAERQTYRDDELTGFGIRIEPASTGGRRSFFWNQKVSGEVYFRSLGEWPAISVKVARDRAREWAGKASSWKQLGCPQEANPFIKPKKQMRTSVPTFSELVEAYIKLHLLNPDPEIGALNKLRAEYDLRLLVRTRLAEWQDVPIDQITVNDVVAAKNSAEGLYWQNSVVELVRRLYNWSAGRTDGKVNFWAVSNPAKDVSTNKPQKRKKYLLPDELVRFNDELKKEQHADTKDALTILLATGARKSSVYAMRWGDISFETENWDIPMSKSGEGYTVNLTPAAVEVLEHRRREIPKDQVFVFPAPSKSGHITDIKKRWQLFRKRAGIPDARLHDLRRTKGSYAAISGESLQKIAGILGHKSLGSTQIYARLSQESVREASMASDAKMEEMMQQAKKRIKRETRKPKLLKVANG
jgi:integrase